MRRLIGMLLIVLPAQSLAWSESDEERFRALSAELRCLVCQNQSIADSGAPLAEDLRAQVHKMIEAGRSDREIKDYMTARYGDFVLYRPPLKASTVALWCGPFVLLLLGLWVVWRQRGPSGGEARAVDSEVDRERLNRLLGRDEQ